MSKLIKVLLTCFLISGCNSTDYVNKVSENVNDLNEDGSSDISYIDTDNGYYQLVDRNFDERVDETHHYNKEHNILRSMIDDDFDGYLETELLFDNGYVYQAFVDSDNNGLRDTFYFYVSETLIKSKRYLPNHKGNQAIETIFYNFGYPSSRKSAVVTKLSEKQFEAKWCQECESLIVMPDCLRDDLILTNCSSNKYEDKNDNYESLEYLYDLNKDGTKDIYYEYSLDNGYYQLTDRNFDGRIDQSHHYNNKDKILKSRIDDDFDGYLETEVLYDKGSINQVYVDSNNNGFRDIFFFYESGTLIKSIKYYASYEGEKALGTISYKLGHPSKEKIEKTNISEEQFESKWCQDCEMRLVPVNCEKQQHIKKWF